ncbi:hypothetical protein WA026_004574 [Henosepilachna vigintioctopunctata]|uniref:Uncharacterized protein n=1 Tax=Henosepilachna vigintioctopunctata TaxID=420089 RepID=A0AAW1V212_9CUCU
MEQKYTEIISKHGPLFMNLKYMERLNLEDSSLAKEKWTTELFETIVEVMPIILENEEYDKKNENECQLMNGNSTNTLTQANIENPIPTSLEKVSMGFLDPRKASGSESWWISMDEDTQSDRLEQSEPLFLRPTPTEELKTGFGTEPKSKPAAKVDMEILFEKAAEPSYTHEKNEESLLEDYQPVKKHFHLATYPHQDVEIFANPLIGSDNLDPVSSGDKQEKQKMKFPISDSNERTIHEIKSGRIARPLSSKYCLRVTKDISLKPTTSVMHLPLHEDKNNLSSLYDELYAEIMEKKFNPFSTKRKSKGPVLEVFRNPNYEQIPRTSKNQTPPTNTKLETDIKSPNLEKKDENISRKRTHQNI